MGLKLRMLKAEETGRKAKATIHTSGKLGFSGDAIDYLAIKEGKSIQFAQNEDDEKDINLYAVLYDTMQEGALRINKAGSYYYVNTKSLFDTLYIPYKDKRIIYDLVKFEYEGQPFIKMLRREIKKNNKDLPVR
jgi:hypothetical protein